MDYNQDSVLFKSSPQNKQQNSIQKYAAIKYQNKKIRSQTYNNVKNITSNKNNNTSNNHPQFHINKKININISKKNINNNNSNSFYQTNNQQQQQQQQQNNQQDSFLNNQQNTLNLDIDDQPDSNLNQNRQQKQILKSILDSSYKINQISIHTNNIQINNSYGNINNVPNNINEQFKQNQTTKNENQPQLSRPNLQNKRNFRIQTDQPGSIPTYQQPYQSLSPINNGYSSKNSTITYGINNKTQQQNSKKFSQSQKFNFTNVLKNQKKAQQQNILNQQGSSQPQKSTKNSHSFYNEIQNNQSINNSKNLNSNINLMENSSIKKKYSISQQHGQNQTINYPQQKNKIPSLHNPTSQTNTNNIIHNIKNPYTAKNSNFITIQHEPSAYSNSNILKTNSIKPLSTKNINIKQYKHFQNLNKSNNVSTKNDEGKQFQFNNTLKTLELQNSNNQDSKNQIRLRKTRNNLNFQNKNQEKSPYSQKYPQIQKINSQNNTNKQQQQSILSKNLEKTDSIQIQASEVLDKDNSQEQLLNNQKQIKKQIRSLTLNNTLTPNQSSLNQQNSIFKANLTTKNQKQVLEKKDIHNSFIKKNKDIQQLDQQQQHEEKYKDWDDTKVPYLPQYVLKYYGQYLKDYEKFEITTYNNIFFIGQNAKKLEIEEKNKENNQGFDNEKGDYIFKMNDHIAYRYEILDDLGKGSFGQVLKVYDHKRKELSALKIIRNKQKFYNQSIVELKILKFIRDNDQNNQTNIVKIKDFVIFRNHVCIIFELLSMNLYDFLRRNQFQGISLELIRRFAIQILQGLMFLEKHKIIHCDLKPENILLKSENKSGIKLIDFGSSCFESEKIFTYIQSRFYRAPEILLGIPYTGGIDMWSFGCIMAELYMGYPLFPGENELQQFQMFMEILDIPDDEFLLKCQRGRVFFNDDFTPKLKIEQNGQPYKVPGGKKLNDFMKCDDTNFLNFVNSCITWKSEERMTPSEAITHTWILDGLPQEIRAQHLIQMEKNMPHLDLSQKFIKYNVKRPYQQDLKQDSNYTTIDRNDSNHANNQNRNKSLELNRKKIIKQNILNQSQSIQKEKSQDNNSNNTQNQNIIIQQQKQQKNINNNNYEQHLRQIKKQQKNINSNNQNLDKEFQSTTPVNIKQNNFFSSTQQNIIQNQIKNKYNNNIKIAKVKTNKQQFFTIQNSVDNNNTQQQNKNKQTIY